ncbi:MAG: aminotransferase class III-fold pyridoxal phosphate-dependent enzyme [Chloroflexi bacterium]|nr:aminotransferase class III-fold pyridoxal phosphate-dependent enzyme [Chloroflexota bacterium]
MLPEYAQYLSPVWSRYTDLLVDHAEGPYLYTDDNRRILDFSTGIGVTNTGHCHPAVVQAAQAQLGRLMHGQINIVYHQPVLDLVKELLTVVPAHLNRFFFSNSGAEAVEASIKLARHATQRPNIIVFQGSFHGRTIGTMSLTTSNTIYRVGYQPLMSGVFVAPYPYAYRYGWSDEETVRFCLRELRLLLKTQTAPQETAAILIEPLLGEGGYVVPPLGFLKGLEQICHEHGILLIADEVQSGFGRTGKWFGHQYEEIEPDIMVMAKGLASGLPLSAIAARSELMEKWITGSHGGTYSANAVSCAAAAATVRVMREENLIENSRQMGEILMRHLKAVKDDFPCIGDVRGRGLMIATEFTTPDGEPDTHMAKTVWKLCLDNNLLLLTCGPYGNVIRWIPPLVINEKHITEALQKFQAALDRAAAS